MKGEGVKEREEIEAGVKRGKLINGELTWESWEGYPNGIGEKVYARCVELNVFAGPCSSEAVAIHSLALATLGRLEQLGFQNSIQYFRAVHLTQMAKRG